jgi:hypothetical protein
MQSENTTTSSCAIRSADGRPGRGAVVSNYGDVKLVEISDARGVALDFIQVPETGLRLMIKHSA